MRAAAIVVLPPSANYRLRWQALSQLLKHINYQPKPLVFYIVSVYKFVQSLKIPALLERGQTEEEVGHG